MRRLVVLAIVLTCFISFSGYSQQEMERWTTQGNYNGFWIETKMLSTEGSLEIKTYIKGLIDCAIRIDPEAMERYYSKVSKDNVIGAVLAYYEQYPDKKYMPVVDLIINGFNV